MEKKEIQGENRNITGMNILAAEDNQLNMEILQFLLEEAESNGSIRRKTGSRIFCGCSIRHL